MLVAQANTGAPSSFQYVFNMYACVLKKYGSSGVGA